MTGPYKHKRRKHRLMIYLFIVFQTCNNKCSFGSATHMRMVLMENLEVDLLADTDHIYLTQ